MMKMMALIAVVMASGCGAEPAPTAHLVATLEAGALAAHSLGASSLPEMQLLATPGGRDVLSQVVSCALPRGASITAITRDGMPYSFAGSAGLAPAWAARAANPAEQRRVSDCVRARAAGAIRT